MNIARGRVTSADQAEVDRARPRGGARRRHPRRQGLSRQPLTSAAELAGQALGILLADLALPADAELLVLTNGLGGTPDSELSLLHGDVVRILRERSLRPVWHLVGSFVTSLEMAGASISLLHLDDELTCLWDAPARTPGADAMADTPIDAAFAVAWMNAAAASLEHACVRLTELDAARGDADRGVLGFAAIAQQLEADPPATAGDAPIAASKTLRRAMGGTSGPLWSAALRRAGKTLSPRTRRLRRRCAGSKTPIPAPRRRPSSSGRSPARSRAPTSHDRKGTRPQRLHAGAYPRLGSASLRALGVSARPATAHAWCAHEAGRMSQRQARPRVGVRAKHRADLASP